MILLGIDDNPDNLTSLKAVIEDAFPEAKVLTALNGIQGIELAQTESPDVILLDVVMPGMDGFEVCRKLKEDARTQNLPVVFLTALKTNRGSRIKALEAGADGFLTKPIDEAELIAQIRAMVKIKAAYDQQTQEKKRLSAMVAERTRHLEQELAKRKRAEETLIKSEEKFRLIAENTGDTITVLDLNLNVTYVSPSIKNIRGYTVQEAMGHTLDQIFTPESNNKVLNVFEEQMALEASRTTDPGRVVTIEVEEYHKNGSTILVEMSLSLLRDSKFTPIGIVTVTRDITDRKKAEAAIEKSYIQLSMAFETTVQTLAVVVENRDYYTAGHQRRVAVLARTIAVELGLTDEQIKGLYLASTIHDIGKIAIPGEILIKPTKLTEIEFSLIKAHAQAGYDILKAIEFPWPIADIVLQHHERMNGSGYPNGLIGKDILMESRILSVADVVEAIASHRPYRPAKGIDAALKEIQEKRGILYDLAVVDACFTLFKEKGYQLSGIGEMGGGVKCEKMRLSWPQKGEVS